LLIRGRYFVDPAIIVDVSDSDDDLLLALAIEVDGNCDLALLVAAAFNGDVVDYSRGYCC
jgi:hypothetical protein